MVLYDIRAKNHEFICHFYGYLKYLYRPSIVYASEDGGAYEGEYSDLK